MRAYRLSFLILVFITLTVEGLTAGGATKVSADDASAIIWRVVTEHPSAASVLGRQLFAIVFLHLIAGVFIWSLGCARLPWTPPHSQRTVGALLADFVGTGWLLLRLNSYLFPLSVWSWILDPILNQALSWLIDIAAVSWVGLRLVLICAQTLRGSRRSLAVALVVVVLAVSVGSATLYFPLSPAPGDRHNVIIIGIDSLRRDIALAPAADNGMPAFSAFRDKSFVQRNVVSPLARTFPAWTTILTGESPPEHGARFNLINPDRIDTQRSIAWQFRKKGYRTIYATDETRFSNVGKTFGFDQVVSPKPGLADFVLGQFFDQPLVNLFIQLPYAEYLLPSLVGNRAFAEAYRPQRFVNRLSDALHPDDHPLFLAVHLCLPHWPYTWAAESTDAHTGFDRYRQSLKAVDSQFGSLETMLRQKRIWNDQSLIVVLADHGEGFPEHDPESWSSVIDDDKGAIDLGAGGHGASLLQFSEWQIFTLFSGSGVNSGIEPGASDQLHSLADIAGTIARLEGLNPDGRRVMEAANSLGINQKQQSQEPLQEAISVETGFRPAGFNIEAPDPKRALEIAASSYDIGEGGKVTLKNSLVDKAIERKDFGVTDGFRALVLAQSHDSTRFIYADSRTHVLHSLPTGSVVPQLDIPLMKAACANTSMSESIKAWCPSDISDRSTHSAP